MDCCCRLFCCRTKPSGKDDESTEGSEPLMTEEEKQKALLGMTIETESPPDKIDMIVETKNRPKRLSVGDIQIDESEESRTDYSGLVPELLKATGKGKSAGDIEIDSQDESNVSGKLVPHNLSGEKGYEC